MTEIYSLADKHPSEHNFNLVHIYWTLMCINYFLKRLLQILYSIPKFKYFLYQLMGQQGLIIC